MNKQTMSVLLAIAGLHATAACADEVSWTGPHVGVFAGANNVTVDTEDYWCWAACDAPSTKAVKPQVGGSIGYDVQVDDALLVGVETDLASGGTSQFISPNPSNAQTLAVNAWTNKLAWTATVRGKAGLVQGNTAIYVTGGYALAQADLREVTSGTRTWNNHAANFGAAWSGRLPGYVVGVGIEHRFGRASVKLEGLHHDFAIRSKCLSDSDGVNAGLCWTGYLAGENNLRFHPKQTSLRIGINYRL